MLEAVSAAPTHHDAIEQLLGFERQRFIQADTHAAEREHRNLPSDNLREELERGLASHEAERMKLADCETGATVFAANAAVAVLGHSHRLGFGWSGTAA